MEAVYITVAVLTGIAGIGGLTYQCRQNIQCYNAPQANISNHSTVNSANEVPGIIKEVIDHNLQRNSDETDIDIKIHIENKMRETAIFTRE